MDLRHVLNPVALEDADAQPLLSHLPNSKVNLSGPTTSAQSEPRAGLGGPVSSSISGIGLSARPKQAGAVIAKIEDIFESMADCILDEKKELIIHLKSRAKKPSRTRNESHSKDEPAPKKKSGSQITSIAFPSKSPQEAWKFTAILRILELSHEALVSGIVTTKRDIFYRDPELFLRQAVVDRYVDDIACTLGVERDALNVVAAAKGLIAGSLKATRKDLSTFDCSGELGGCLIPNSKELHSLDLVDVRWILVVEKEVLSAKEPQIIMADLNNQATFRTLATSLYWRDSLAGKGVLITAKGYPDIQTRQFLNLLSSLHPTIPILALVDFDPDGLGITSTYKHGSISLAHEHNLAVASIQWLGIRSQDFLHSECGEDAHGLLKLTVRDRRIATKMLEKEDVFGEEGTELEWRREVQAMLMLNVKAEIQILGNGDSLARWLDGKLMGAIGEA